MEYFFQPQDKNLSINVTLEQCHLILPSEYIWKLNSNYTINIGGRSLAEKNYKLKALQRIISSAFGCFESCFGNAQVTTQWRNVTDIVVGQAIVIPTVYSPALLPNMLFKNCLVSFVIIGADCERLLLLRSLKNVPSGLWLWELQGMWCVSNFHIS